MEYKHEEVAEVAKQLKSKLEKAQDKRQIFRASELIGLYEVIKTFPNEERASFGKEVNALKKELERLIDETSQTASHLSPIDVTAPFDVNGLAHNKPKLLPAENGSKHPLMAERDKII